MINKYEKDNSPTQKENQKSAIKMVILPLIGFIIFVIIIFIFILKHISVNQQSTLNWLNISIITISVFLFIPGIFLLVLILGSIKAIDKSRQPIQAGLWKLQHHIFIISKILVDITKMIVKPFIYLESVLSFFHRPRP
jgi:hypothetical protein